MIKRTSVILATILMSNLPVVAFEAFGVAEGEPVGGFVESAGVLFGVVEASGEPPPFSPLRSGPRAASRPSRQQDG